MIVVLYLGITENELPLLPIIILSLVIGFIVWVLLDTRYVIKNHFLLYRSGPFRGRIDIENIQKIKTTEELKIFLKGKHLYDELIQKLKSNNKNKKIDKI